LEKVKMSSYNLARKSSLSAFSPLLQAIMALAGGLALFFCLLMAVLIGYDALHAGQIYPGVSVAGVDISGLKPQEAEALLGQRLTYPQDGKIVFQDGKRVWIARPIEIGLFLDVETSAKAAYNLGRHGGPFTRLREQFEAWYSGKDLPPLLVYDERMTQHYLEDIAAQVNKPTVEASLSINGLDVVVQPGQVGRTLYLQSTMAPVEEQLRSLSDGIVPLVISETPPGILDASQQAQVAQNILSAPLTLVLPDAQDGDPGPWKFEPQKLASMLTINRVEAPDGAHYQVGLDTTQLRSFLEDLAPRLSRTPDNARFIFNDDTRQLEVIQHAVTGRSLDVEATIQAVNEKLVQGEHTIPLSIIVAPPAVGDDATAQQLGITELVSNQISYFYGSSGSRIKNIQTAAARFHGLLVPPGATFSMADALGDVSLDTGYSEALIIYGNRTIQGVGGGVCQVSTTLFRTVFFGGYPVVERYPHAYRVYYYELTRAGNVDTDLAGLDATVFVPVVDFKFTNDTPNWLLMETYVNPAARSLNWKFYSTSDGRKVNWDTSGLQNTVEPPAPLYQENPDLAKGEIEQVDWAVDGADVTISRTVLKAGQVYFSDQFSTHYLPWRSVFEYGPGTKLPKDADTGEN
jgi:vancomycin resistance protein YoaR